ncbi:ABC transporter ATP-binding protein [Streptosporangium lutulentum]|uniref:ATP-binding cassette subfamily B protein n=1 Tax=Streptosporangium lutulentum TaxID=1461250 RepID=A0ABT9QMD0_9ACTN|nr:ABC transporter ATP-binding protein [Streptosporangium lutulentum]MDP9847867.1 ATP-binding cassette subfamily B protein [Streptosporangium lutulentum]
MTMMGGGSVFGGAGNAPGLPFAGVPQEMQAGVDALIADEPQHLTEPVVFSHRRGERDRRPLTLRRLLARHKRSLVAALALVAVESATLQAGPKLTQVGIDDGILKHSMTVVVTVALIYLASVGLTGLASAARVRVTGRLAAWVMHDLRITVFTHLQRLSMGFFTAEKAGVLMTRMTSDVENLQQLVQDGLAQFAIQGLTMVVVTAVLFGYNVKLALITVVVIVPVLTALSLWFRHASNIGYSRARDGISATLADLSESLHGISQVRASDRRSRNILAHRKVVGQYRDANDDTALINGIYGPSTQLVGFLGQAMILAVSGHMVLRHELTVGELIAFSLYLNSFFAPIQQLVQLYNVYQQGQSSVTKLRELLDTEPTVAESPDAAELPPVRGELLFEDVGFGYLEDRPVLSGVNLRVRAGETIALVGPTGAGKSTLARLIVRFYDPTGGRVLIDGHDLRDLSITSLRRQLGVVPQEPFLFGGTIRDNVSFGRPEATDEEVWEAIRATGLESLVERMPEGIDTVVHERGQSLSSGERQLLALARAFLVRPRVLVLDEATSNLDLQSESRIEAALDALLEGRTAVLVAHRLSTAMKADRIAVVDDGRVIEVGGHDELVAAGGRYADMFATWSRHGGAPHEP